MSNIRGYVVIGGGSGFIGTALVRHLRKRNYETLVVSRKPGPNKITWFDITEKDLPMETTSVINLTGQNILASSRRWTEGFQQNVWASRVKSTELLREKIIKARKRKKIKSFITMSGVGYYPPSETAEYDEESICTNGDFFSELCTYWEAAAQMPPESDTRVVNIRSGVVLGRQGGMIKKLFLPFYLGLGGPISSGRQFLPWIHIHDLVSLITFAMENDSVSGIVNGVAPNIITNGEFAKAFGRALWRPAILPTPAFLLNFLFNKERAVVMTEGQKVIPKKALAAGFTYRYPDIDSATKEFAKLIYKEEKL